MKKLKLNQMANEKLLDQEMKLVNGGTVCGRYATDGSGRGCSCGCYYADRGGSSTDDNCNANFNGGAHGLDSRPQ